MRRGFGHLYHLLNRINRVAPAFRLRLLQVQIDLLLYLIYLILDVKQCLLDVSCLLALDLVL